MAVNERFTDLPTTTNAQMSDIICAVQNYVSPSNLGLSVQETLGQIFSLFQTNIILYNAGNPNGLVAGTTYQFCWDTTNSILYICTTSGTALSAVWSKAIKLTAGSGITISQSANNIQISASSSQLDFNSVTGTSATMVSNNAYQANNAGLVTLTLPATSSFGDIIWVSGYGAGGWQVAQNAGQSIIVGASVSTVGATGYIASSNQYDSIQLFCAVSNTTWQVSAAPQGIITVF